MRLLYKIQIIIFIFQSVVFSIGTQFLAIPRNPFELIFGINPAIVRYQNQPIISASYGSWLADMTISSVDYNRKIFNGWGGVNFRYISMNDLELRTERPTDEPISHFSSSAFALDGKYIQQFNFSVLSSVVRYVNMQLYNETADGFAADIGLLHNFTKNFNVGIAVYNLGMMSKLYEKKPELPLRTIIGATYNVDFDQYNNLISVAAEKSSLVDGLILRIGDSFSFDKIQFLIGTQITNNATSLSGGINFNLGNYQFGYGVQIGTQTIGTPQHLSLSIILP